MLSSLQVTLFRAPLRICHEIARVNGDLSGVADDGGERALRARWINLMKINTT